MKNMASLQINILWQQKVQLCVCEQQKLNYVANVMF